MSTDKNIFDAFADDKTRTLTLRDQFAIAALSGLVEGEDWPVLRAKSEAVAKTAYTIADAMMKERE